MPQDVTAAVVAVAGASLLLWTLCSALLGRVNVTPAIAFVIIGFAVNNPPLALIHVGLHASSIRLVAEFALALVLFADASTVNLRNLRADAALPARLLGLGLPLTIGLGAVLAATILQLSNLWLAALIGAIVAPTDAALGLAIVRDQRVPLRIRRLLNVESGLNDGISTPFVNLFLAGALSTQPARSLGGGHAAAALLGGLLVGAVIGCGAALLRRLAESLRWSEAGYYSLGTFAVPLLTYGAALSLGGNGFVAAFVAGIAYGTLMPASEAKTIGLTDEIGELMSLLVWFLFGAAMVPAAFAASSWRDLAFAIATLTAGRMLPVAIALIGSGLKPATTLFVGWFGPRGLASVVFALIAVDSLGRADAEVVLAAVTSTVLVSVLAHGFSAGPLARRYAAAVAAVPPEDAEHAAAPPLTDDAMAGHRRRLRLSPQSAVR